VRAGVQDMSDVVRLTLLVLKTCQVERLRSFYQAVGVAFTQERHGSGPLHYAGRVGDVILEVYPLPDSASAADSTTRLGFAVADLGRVLQALQATGTSVQDQPRATAWGSRAVVHDPDGRSVELYQA
jgi:predicted enzyme related to lactoylglutathione lyase